MIASISFIFFWEFNSVYLDELEWQVTLMESMNKRCLFLEHVVGHTGLTNVQVVRGRAEVRGHCVYAIKHPGLFSHSSLILLS